MPPILAVDLCQLCHAPCAMPNAPTSGRKQHSMRPWRAPRNSIHKAIALGVRGHWVNAKRMYNPYIPVAAAAVASWRQHQPQCEMRGRTWNSGHLPQRAKRGRLGRCCDRRWPALDGGTIACSSQNCCKRRGNRASGTLVLIAVIGSVAQRGY